MKTVRKVVYLPPKVAEEMEKNAKNYTSESAYMVEAVRAKNRKERKGE